MFLLISLATPLVLHLLEHLIMQVIYLAGHSRPDIACAVHWCACYMFGSKCHQEAALRHIVWCLKGAANNWVIMTPTNTLDIDCFPDVDFAGLYGHHDYQDPHCAKRWTGYVILVAGCPIVWKSKLQTEIALSIMEAEYAALSTACKDLLPFISMNIFLAIQLTSIPLSTRQHWCPDAWNLEPCCMTPHSKYYTVKYHWFCRQLCPNNMQLLASGLMIRMVMASPKVLVMSNSNGCNKLMRW